MTEKGSIAIDQLFLAILGMIFGVVVLLIIANATGGLGFLMEWLNQMIGDQEPEADEKVELSLEALQCAINSVGLGEIYNDCAKPREGISLQTQYLEPDPDVICGDIAANYVCCGKPVYDCMNCLVPQEIGTKYEWLSACSGAYYNADESACLAEKGEKPSAMECTVKNFQLPQEVSNTQDWILNYGNPNYLVYWNQFPQEEDTWNHEIDWKSHLLFAAVSLVPVGRVMGSSLKLGWTAIIGKGSGTFKEIAKQQLKDIFGESAFNQLGKKGIKQFSKTFVAYPGRSTIIKEFFKKRTKELLFQTLTVNKGRLKGPILKFASLEIAAAALADSVLKPYEPIGNNLGLAEPYKDVISKQLISDVEGIPVLVKWNDEKMNLPFRDENVYKNLHFASPCYLDQFTMHKETVKCDEYNIDLHSSSNPKPVCINPYPTSDKNLPQCNVFEGDDVDVFAGEHVYEKIDRLLKGDKSLFEYDENSILRKIYLPIHSLDPGLTYLEVTFNPSKSTRVEDSETIIFTYPAPSWITIDGFTETIYYDYTLKQEGLQQDITGELICENFIAQEPEKTITDIKDYSAVTKCYIRNDPVLGDLHIEMAYETEDIIPEANVDYGQFKNRLYTTQIYKDNDNSVNFVENIKFENGLLDTWQLLLLEEGDHALTFTDIDSSGNFKFAGKTDCRIDAIVADLGGDLGLNDYLSDVDGDNYCLRHQSETEVVIEVGTQTVTGIGQAALLLASPFTGGTTTALFVASVGIQAGVDMVMDYRVTWPG